MKTIFTIVAAIKYRCTEIARVPGSLIKARTKNPSPITHHRRKRQHRPERRSQRIETAGCHHEEHEGTRRMEFDISKDFPRQARASEVQQAQPTTILAYPKSL
jgi:hypothetical protein